MAGDSLLGGSEEQEMRLQGSLGPAAFCVWTGSPICGPGVGVGAGVRNPAPVLIWPFPSPQSHLSLLNAALPFCILVGWLLGFTQLGSWAEPVPWAARADGPVSLVQVAYPDCSPVMILSEASLADLNTRMEKKVKIDNFRPNIVVTGCSAFEEVSGSLLLCIMSRGAPESAPSRTL